MVNHSNWHSKLYFQGPIPQGIPPPPPSPRALRQKQQLEHQLSLGSAGSPPSHITGRPTSPLVPRSPGAHGGSHTLPKSPLALRKPLQQQHSLPATLFPPAPQTPPPLSPLIPKPTDPPLEPIKLAPVPLRSPLHQRQLSDASDPRGHQAGRPVSPIPPMLVAHGRTMSSGGLLVPDPRPASPPISMLTGFYPHNLQIQQVLHRATSSGTISTPPPQSQQPQAPAPLSGVTTDQAQQQQSLQNSAASAVVSMLQGATSPVAATASAVDQAQQWQQAQAQAPPPVPPSPGPSTPQSAVPPPPLSPGVAITSTTSTTAAVTTTTTVNNSNNPFFNISTSGSAIAGSASVTDPTTLLLDQLEYHHGGGSRSRSYTVGASGPVRPVATKPGQGQVNVGHLPGIAQSIGDFTAFDISGQTSTVRYPWQKDIGVQCELLSDSSSTSSGGSRSLGSGSSELRSAGTQTNLSHLRDEPSQVCAMLYYTNTICFVLHIHTIARLHNTLSLLPLCMWTMYYVIVL